MNAKTLVGFVVLLAVVSLGAVLVIKNKSTLSPSSSSSITNNSYSGTTSGGGNPEPQLSAPTVGSTAIPLVISSPANGATVKTASITVRGKTAPNADVSLNDVDVKADGSGNFSASLSLEEGENFIAITAVDPDGNSADQDLSVTYDSGF